MAIPDRAESQPLLAEPQQATTATSAGTFRPRTPSSTSSSSAAAAVAVATSPSSHKGPSPIRPSARSPTTDHAAGDPRGGRLPSPARSAHSYMSENETVMNLARAIKEAKRTLRLSLPSITSYVLSFANRLVVTFMVGHLGANELAASTLAVMFGNVAGFSICFGLSSALDTLASQAVTGASNPRQAGVFLQRAILINLMLAIPISLLWVFAEPLLRLAHQDAELSRMAGSYIRIMLVSFAPNIVRDLVAKFLNAQGIMQAQFYVYLVVLPFNVALQYTLVYLDTPIRLGFYGAAWGSVISDIFSALLIIAYAVFISGHQCWQPWSRQALYGWGQYLRLGFPGMLMVCAEWWMFEIVALIAGVFGARVLAAQSIIINTSSIVYMTYLGISVVNSNRIGNFLGAGKPMRAKFSAQVSIAMAFVFSLVLGTAVLVFRRQWASLFTNDMDVVALTAAVLPVCALFQFADGGVCVTGGVLRGCGKQHVGAVLNLVAYYVIGLPFSALLTFYFDLQLLGIWLGLAAAQILCYAVQVMYVNSQIDWASECRVAQQRVNHNFHVAAVAHGLDEDDDDLIEDEDDDLLLSA
ncbi:mate-domain-containing protein [Blastocladiella britannica]|nr:mate-domain-containing protein [Blastocladiella britannica]